MHTAEESPLLIGYREDAGGDEAAGGGEAGAGDRQSPWSVEDSMPLMQAQGPCGALAKTGYRAETHAHGVGWAGVGWAGVGWEWEGRGVAAPATSVQKRAAWRWRP